MININHEDFGKNVPRSQIDVTQWGRVSYSRYRALEQAIRNIEMRASVAIGEEKARQTVASALQHTSLGNPV